MKCHVEGCDREVQYQRDQVCQKHYFRFMRYGTYELTKTGKAAPRITNPAGYVKIYSPNHPLITKGQIYVYEHRAIIYAKYGECLPPCVLCQVEINWKTCHIDHIDEDISNNSEENLRPLCRTCNTRRNLKLKAHEHRGHYAITIDGQTKTPNEWARDPKVNVTVGTILRRKRNGYSDQDAVFADKKTRSSSRTPSNF